jgi:hypothetical protein
MTMPREERKCKRSRTDHVTRLKDYSADLEEENKDIRRLSFDEYVFRRKLPGPGEAITEKWTTYHEGSVYTTSMTCTQSEGYEEETDTAIYDICTSSPYEKAPEAVSPRSPRSPDEMFTPIEEACPFARCSRRHETTSPCLFPAENYCDSYDS